MSCGVGCRRGLDPVLLCLWRRPASTDPIRPLAWEPPYATGSGPRKGKKTKKKRKRKMDNRYEQTLHTGNTSSHKHIKEINLSSNRERQIEATWQGIPALFSNGY